MTCNRILAGGGAELLVAVEDAMMLKILRVAAGGAFCLAGALIVGCIVLSLGLFAGSLHWGYLSLVAVLGALAYLFLVSGVNLLWNVFPDSAGGKHR